MCFTAHVRHSTTPQHVHDYLAAVKQAAEEFPDIDVYYSVETKILDTSGALDLPPDLDLNLLDTLNIADHRFPMDTSLAPEEVAELLRTGQATPDEVWTALLDASVNALDQYPGTILAHPLSIIPKVGLDPQAVPAKFCQALAAALARNDAVLEINEKWRTPTLPLIKAAIAAEVPVVSASDAHFAGETGHFTYLDELDLVLDQD